MLNIPWFEQADIIQFPAPEQALTDPDGLLAAGGNLSVTTLVDAYQQGIFPWYDDENPIMWWSPSSRAVLDTAAIHISKNMKKLMNRGHYRTKVDVAFEHILQACSASTKERPETWITDEMQQAYQRLFDQGYAHCVGVYNGEDELVGGLYGVFVKNCFCGESMFSHEPNTSKLALITLAQFLQKNGCNTIDCQLPTTHLASMGVETMPRAEFLEKLKGMQNNQRLVKQPWGQLWQP